MLAGKFLLLMLTSCQSYFVCSWVSPQENTKLLKSLLHLFTKPLHLEAFLCWDPHTLTALSKEIITSNSVTVRIKVLDEIELPSGYSEHGALVLLDLSCPNSTEFLKSLPWKQYERLRWLFLNSGADASDEEKVLLEQIDLKNMGPVSEIFYVTEQGQNLSVKQGK